MSKKLNYKEVDTIIKQSNLLGESPSELIITIKIESKFSERRDLWRIKDKIDSKNFEITIN